MNTMVAAPSCAEGLGEVPLPSTSRPLHRLAAVRRAQRVSRRLLAQRLNVDVDTIKQQEKETTDISLSTLYQWQSVLEVPIGELLAESGDCLSPPVLKRARMVRIMKTARFIAEHAKQPSIRGMARNFVTQLVDLMPELRHIGAWHLVGRRRSPDEQGVAVQRGLSVEDFFRAE
jgi:transcriptional regulator with XRE-family HTH domain